MTVITKLFNSYVHKQVEKTKFYLPFPGEEAMVKGQLYEVPLKKGICPDGSPTKTYVRKGSNNNLVIMFNGGGVAWDDDSCNYPMTFDSFISGKKILYSGNMAEIAVFGSFLLPKEHGAIEYDAAKNPFYDWNLAFLQYGTGDLHIGQGSHTYKDKKGNEKTIHFQGYTTACEALDKAKELFPNPEKILIVGGSAGAFGCSIMSCEVAERFPNCQNITMFCDSALLMYDKWANTVKNIWHAPKYICEIPKSEDVTKDMLEYTYQHYGDRIKILYSQSTRDMILAKFQNYMDHGVLKYSEECAQYLKRKLKERVEYLKKECSGIHYYIHEFTVGKQKGTEHCVCGSHSWYENKVDGVTPSQYIMDAVNGKLTDLGLSFLD